MFSECTEAMHHPETFKLFDILLNYTSYRLTCHTFRVSNFKNSLLMTEFVVRQVSPLDN